MAISGPAPNRVVENAILPSAGETAAPESVPGSDVSRTRFVPSVLIAQMSVLPLATSQSNAMLVPSRNQAGSPTNPSLKVRRLTPDPSAFIRKSSSCPSRSLANAICAPSGDQAGDPYCAGWLVRLLRFSSLRFSTTKSLGLPSTKAILVPSGDQTGWVPEEVNLVVFKPSGSDI